MLYICLKEIAAKFANKTALNEYTYSDLLTNATLRPYSLVCNSQEQDIVLDLINAAKLNKPLIVLPKSGKESLILPNSLPDCFCLVLYSSGSTGVKKPIIIPEKMLMSSLHNVINLNNLTNSDKILTVCSPNHTAGLTCQTLAGLLVGATVIMKPFNAFTLLRFLIDNRITVTHILPAMTQVLMKLKDTPVLPDLRFVWTGSDCIPRSHVEYWLANGRQVMIAYGMTEAGPPVIYHIFNFNDDLNYLDYGYAVGSKILCQSKIVNNELLLKGNIVNTPDWLKTGDCFEIKDNWYYYTGRKLNNGKIVPKGKI